MGRGRAKAKQTKVARELKYRSVDTDFSSLGARAPRAPDDGPDIPRGLRGESRRVRRSRRATTIDGEGDYGDLRKSG